MAGPSSPPTPAPSLGPGQIHGEIVWKAPLLTISVVGGAIAVPLCAALVVVRYDALVSLLPVDQVRRLLVLAAVIGCGAGLVSGFFRRRLVGQLMVEPRQPTVVPTWRSVVRTYRPRAATVVLLVAIVAYVVASGRAEVLTFMAAWQAGALLGGLVPWAGLADRCQRDTGRRLLVARHRGGKRGYTTALPEDEVEAIVAGDLGHHDRDWLVQLFASLHHGGRFDEAAALGDHLYARWGDPSDAYNTACSLARAGDHDLAVDYLGEALRGGFGRKEMVKDTDLAPLLPRPDVMELYRATRPPAPSALSLGAPPGDGLGEGVGQGSRLDPEGGLRGG